MLALEPVQEAANLCQAIVTCHGEIDRASAETFMITVQETERAISIAEHRKGLLRNLSLAN